MMYRLSKYLFFSPMLVARDIATACAIAVVGLYFFYAYVPLSYWFEYTSIIVSKDVYEGDDVYFVSKTRVKHENIPVEWNDVLTCRRPGTSAFVQEERLQSFGIISESANVDGVTWKFGRTDAPAGSECFLRAYITVLFPFGIRRTENFKGSEFIILPRPEKK